MRIYPLEGEYPGVSCRLLSLARLHIGEPQIIGVGYDRQDYVVNQRCQVLWEVRSLAGARDSERLTLAEDGSVPLDDNAIGPLGQPEGGSAGRPVALPTPNSQPITARLAAAGSRRTELEALLAAAPESATQEELRRLVIEANISSKSTASSRGKVWTQLRLQYVLDPRVAEYRAFREAMRVASSPVERGILCLLMFARTDRLFREVTLNSISPLVGRDGRPVETSIVDEYLTTVAKRENLSWTAETRGSICRHLLSSLKDFGLLTGRAKKLTVRPRPGPQATLFAARLGRLEGLSDRQILQSVWFRLLGLSEGQVVDVFFEAQRAGVLRFQMQAEVVELALPQLEMP